MTNKHLIIGAILFVMLYVGTMLGIVKHSELPTHSEARPVAERLHLTALKPSSKWRIRAFQA